MSTSLLHRLYSGAQALVSKSIRLIGGVDDANLVRALVTDNQGYLKVALGGPHNRQLDTFGLFKVSQPFSIFSGQFRFDSMDDIHGLFVTEETGFGTVTYDSNKVSNILSVGAGGGDNARIKTKTDIPYEPGRTQSIKLTGGFQNSGVSGITKFLGYYNDDNGLTIEQTGVDTYQVNLRSKVTGLVVNTPFLRGDMANNNDRGQWTDKLDGLGVSGATVDFTKNQVWIIDFSWLGHGIIRIGVNFGGVPIYFMIIDNKNGLLAPYMQTGSLPVQAEIDNVTSIAGSTMMFTCCQVESIGGFNPIGRRNAASTDPAAEPLSIANSLAFTPLLSIRVKGSHVGAMLIPRSISVITEDKEVIQAVLILGGTLSLGGGWDPVTNAVEMKTTGSGTITGGRVIASQWTGEKVPAEIVAGPQDVPGHAYDGATELLTLAVRRIKVGSSKFHGSINFEEVF